MSASERDGLLAHLAEGLTTVARCWRLARRDGLVLGFTDHDCDLAFEGCVFRATTGLSASSLVQENGLSVDNAEAMGALSDAAITEEDIAAGRWDGAEVTAWLVNWQEPGQRALRFSGAIGEVRRGAGAFHAELRGLSERLNVPRGRVFHPDCSAVLGDRSCRVDLAAPGYSVEVPVERASEASVFRFAGLAGFSERWFERGRALVTGGAAEGLAGAIKLDRILEGKREITLWEPLGAEVLPGDTVLLEAGCDRRAETCRKKFDNLLNFRGFPHVPGADWLMAVPARTGGNDGGKLKG